VALFPVRRVTMSPQTDINGAEQQPFKFNHPSPNGGCRLQFA
jgi:hypothetical protein